MWTYYQWECKTMWKWRGRIYFTTFSHLCNIVHIISTIFSHYITCQARATGGCGAMPGARSAGGEAKGGKTGTRGTPPENQGAQLSVASPQRSSSLTWPHSHLAGLAWHLIFPFLRTKLHVGQKSSNSPTSGQSIDRCRYLNESYADEFRLKLIGGREFHSWDLFL